MLGKDWIDNERSTKEASLLYKHSPQKSSASSTENLLSTEQQYRRRKDLQKTKELYPVLRKQSRSQSRGVRDHYEQVLAPKNALLFSPVSDGSPTQPAVNPFEDSSVVHPNLTIHDFVQEHIVHHHASQQQ